MFIVIRVSERLVSMLNHLMKRFLRMIGLRTVRRLPKLKLLLQASSGSDWFVILSVVALVLVIRTAVDAVWIS